jgi:hypothetical protein
MELAILIITLGVNILDARFIIIILNNFLILVGEDNLNFWQLTN